MGIAEDIKDGLRLKPQRVRQLEIPDGTYAYGIRLIIVTCSTTVEVKGARAWRIELCATPIGSSII